MELREYISVRRAYNLVRQETETSRRLTFEEFAILCRLAFAGEPLKTSTIAEYQGALRPTMTHRTNHLAKLGFIDRGEGTEDRRNIVCKISDEGLEHVNQLAETTRAHIAAGQPLARTSSERLCRYVDAMGSVYCTAGELVILSLFVEYDSPRTITQLVESLGLLQPTVSMSVSSLIKQGYVARSVSQESSRSSFLILTESGKSIAETLADRISSIIVRRRSRIQ